MDAIIKKFEQLFPKGGAFTSRAQGFKLHVSRICSARHPRDAVEQLPSFCPQKTRRNSRHTLSSSTGSARVVFGAERGRAGPLAN